MFSYDDGNPFVCNVETRSWPQGFHLDDKLSLQEKEGVKIFIGNVETVAVFIRKGPSELISKIKKKMQAPYEKRHDLLNTDGINEENDMVETQESRIAEETSHVLATNNTVTDCNPLQSQAAHSSVEPATENSPRTQILFREPSVLPEEVVTLSEDCDAFEFHCFLAAHEKRISKAKKGFELVKKASDKKKRRMMIV